MAWSGSVKNIPCYEDGIDSLCLNGVDDPVEKRGEFIVAPLFPKSAAKVPI